MSLNFSRRFFPNLSAEEVARRVAEFWNLDHPLPLPRYKIHCPQCRSDEILIRQWRFHKRQMGGKNPCRCDVMFKCSQCSCAWPHGLAVPERMFKRFGPNSWVHWREGYRILYEGDRSKILPEGGRG